VPKKNSLKTSVTLVLSDLVYDRLIGLLNKSFEGKYFFWLFHMTKMKKKQKPKYFTAKVSVQLQEAINHWMTSFLSFLTTLRSHYSGSKNSLEAIYFLF